jgi:hypothetical protein
MSKSHTATVKEPKGNKHSKSLAHLANVAAAQAAKIKANTPILVAIGLIGAAIWLMLLRDFTTAGECMLYIFANNGKLSGRADGNVYMRNGRVRGFIVPRLVQNGYTTLQRSLFAQFSSGWSALTQSEQDSWINVDNVFKSNRFGQSKNVRGKELFIERNVNLVMIGIAPINSYVMSEGVAGITGLDSAGATTTGALTTLSLIFSPTPTSAGVSHLIFATPVLGAGINRPKQSSFRLIPFIMGSGSASPQNILTDYTTKFGSVASTGQKIGIKVVPIDENTGQAGIPIVQVITLS